jgi:hypothetical protein
MSCDRLAAIYSIGSYCIVQGGYSTEGRREKGKIPPVNELLGTKSLWQRRMPVRHPSPKTGFNPSHVLLLIYDVLDIPPSFLIGIGNHMKRL